MNIRTTAVGLIIASWLSAAAKSPIALDMVCIGFGLLMAGIFWPIAERLAFFSAREASALARITGRAVKMRFSRGA